jgi:hypothetical protein
MMTELIVIFFSSVIFIKFRTDSAYIFVQYISQSMIILTSKEKMISENVMLYVAHFLFMIHLHSQNIQDTNQS